MIENPYEILGIASGASLREVETRYRLLLREYHPDLHHQSDAEARAHAELMTRLLNEAMSAIRDDASPGPQAWHRDNSSFFGYQVRNDADAPVAHDAAASGPDGAVPCPFCGTPFERLAEYEAHLIVDHRLRAKGEMIMTAPRRRRRSVIDTIGAVRFVPWWFVVLAAATAALARSFVICMVILAFLALVLWAQGSTRFKSRDNSWRF